LVAISTKIIELSVKFALVTENETAVVAAIVAEAISILPAYEVTGTVVEWLVAWVYATKLVCL